MYDCNCLQGLKESGSTYNHLHYVYIYIWLYNIPEMYGTKQWYQKQHTIIRYTVVLCGLYTLLF